MQTHDNRAKIISAEAIGSWRASLAQADESLAVVAGSFDIFQPGNLAIIRQAARLASRVCVIVDLKEPAREQSLIWNSPAARLEALGHLSQVAAIVRFGAPGGLDDFGQLAPYTFIDCLAQPEDLLRGAARQQAQNIVDFPAIPGCFTRDIADRINHKTSPVPVDPAACLPLPKPTDLKQFQHKHSGRTLVTVNGCFDILHLGHLGLLEQARQQGDALIVLVNDDASIRAYKGPQRPIFPIHFRLTALRALAAVSFAYPFAGDNPLDLLAQIQPNIHVKGGSYEDARVRQEQALLSSWGGRLVFQPLLAGYSTTDLINRAS